MNKMVREVLPVSELPERLRRRFAPEANVVVTIESTDADAPASAVGSSPEGMGHFSRFKEVRRTHFASGADIDDHVLALREEWDRR
jgi:hypothetical protein